MGFFTNYARNAFRMSDDELKILKFIVSHVEEDLPFSEKPSILIEKLKICWAPEMIFKEDATYGMWTYTKPNSVFVRPEENEPMAYRIEWNSAMLSAKEKDILETMKRKKCYSEVMFKDIPNVEHQLLTLAIHLLENDGHATTTILHEMWHRQQFMSNPLKYLASCLVTNLVNYEWACTQSWSIENDVRVKVDNDALKSKLKNLYTPFYGFIRQLNLYYRTESDDERKAMADELKEIAKDEFISGMMKLVEK